MTTALAELEEGVPKEAEQRSLALDCLSIALISGLSAEPYLPRLGFYSDDWDLLAGFSVQRGSLAQVIAAAFPARPVQGFYLDLLFRCFGLAPLGYHIVNAMILATGAVLLYLLLLRLRLGHSQSFATAALFIMLPQLSTVRVWYAAFQIPLSMVLMLISLHLQLSYARRHRAIALAGAIAASLLSIGAYEIFAPLIVGFAAALGFTAWQSRPPDNSAGCRASVIPVVVWVAASVLLVAYKLLSSGRAGSIADPSRYIMGLRELFRTDYDWRIDSGLNIFAMANTYFWAPVRGAVIGFRALVTGQAGFEEIAIGSLMAVIVWWRLHMQRRCDMPGPTRLLQLGIATTLLGNATFLIVPAIVFTSTGIDNRVQVAAALGVAMVFVALIRMGSDRVSPRYRQIAFSIFGSAVTASAFVRLADIENYWAEAAAIQGRVLSAARADLRDLPPNSIVILDGICPYHGPAVVFETNWDTAGALTLALGQRVSADVVSSRMTVTNRGLATSIYSQPSSYAYGQNLYVYDVAHRLLVRLPNADTSVNYFRKRSQRNCPGFVARGVEV